MHTLLTVEHVQAYCVRAHACSALLQLLPRSSAVNMCATSYAGAEHSDGSSCMHLT
jgi:hypothetical protein